jgi:hypothetical protein
LRSALRTCSLAGHWTEANASQWWEEHAQSARAGPAEGAWVGRVEAPRSIALDLAARALE